MHLLGMEMRVVIILLMGFVFHSSISQKLPAQEFASADAFEQTIQPYLNQFCLGCHGPQKQKAGLRVDQLDPDLVSGSDADMWQEILDLTNLSEMPPEEALQPMASERSKMAESLSAALRHAMEFKRSTGGRNVMRRMTAYEYSNTLRDLLDLDLRFAVDLPPEGTAKEGFKNNSTVLGTSSLHLEYFERIARASLERILLAPNESPTPYFVHVEPEHAFKVAEDAAKKGGNDRNSKNSGSYNLKQGDHFKTDKNVRAPLFKLDHGQVSPQGIILAGNRPQDKVGDAFAEGRKIGGAKGDGRSGWQPEFRIEMYEVPHDTPVLVRVRCAAIPGKGGELPRLSFELGSFRGNGVSDQKEAGNVQIPTEQMEIYEFVVEGANFPFQSNKPGRPSYFRIFNDYRRGTSDLAYEDLPKLDIDWVEITSNYYPTWPSKQYRKILFDPGSSLNEAKYAREVIERFMERAYRRPVSSSEVDRKYGLFEKLKDAEPSVEHAMISTLTAVLCSPNFLLLSEPELNAVVSTRQPGKRPTNDFELASRLSYFLWSSMPDDTLFGLASEGQLHLKENLIAQTQRMLADPKSRAFSENFASQWLDLAGIRRLAVNPEYFKFEEKTKDLFEEESIRFVHHVLSENLSIDNFIDSEFALLNPVLARHYRIPGISGGFQVVNLAKEQHRGGLLTQASMLFGNSTGAETHPIKRGVWVLERMLDDPPSPPPPNVPELDQAQGSDEKLLTLKEKLIAHADNESCRDCHRKIDPWGLAFENYNALGQWREGSTDPLVLAPHQSVEIDPRTELPNGKNVDDLDALKAYLLNEKKGQFRRAMVRKVMAYALGRYLEFADRSDEDRICDSVRDNGDTFQYLIQQVVLSDAFQMK